MDAHGDADDHDPPSVGPSRPRRGLGFFPDPVIIKAAPYPTGGDGPRQPRPQGSTGPLQFPQSYSSWDEWKAWNTGPASTLSRRPPPVFVRPDVVKTGYEQSADGGFGVDVQTEYERDPKPTAAIHPGKAAGNDIADWYRSLAAKRSEAQVKVEPEADAPDLATGAAKSAAALPSGSELEKPEEIHHTVPGHEGPHAHSNKLSVTSPEDAASERPAPLRVNASEWFIRRALAKKHAGASAPNPPPPPRPSSISSMLNIAGAAARPPPRPRYALGPENAGYARLADLGWSGGGLGRPLDPPSGSGSRSGTDTPEAPALSRSPTSAPPHADGELSTRPTTDDEDGNDLESMDEDEFVPGPGRTQPVATALKLDRRGLGSAALEKKVTHSAAEIRRAQRSAGREKGENKHKQIKRDKVKWAQKDRREREERKRLLAALNA